VWQRYLRLQQYRWQSQVELQNPQTWAAALFERRTVRREILGAAWAHAFYGEEERALEAEIAALNAGVLPGKTVVKATDPVQLALPDAAQRVAAVDAEWQAWEGRLSAARTQVGDIARARHLSEPQRQQAINDYINANFDERERLRVRALLRL
jgi:lipase chaperone LimK